MQVPSALKDGVGTLWPNLNRLSRLVPCGKRYFTFAVKPGTLQISNSSSYHQLQASVAPTLHSNENGRENTFFTERSHSEQSHLGLTGSCETGGIALSEVRTKCANSILVRCGGGIFSWIFCFVLLIKCISDRSIS